MRQKIKYQGGNICIILEFLASHVILFMVNKKPK